MMKWEAITLLRNLEDSLDSYCELNEEGKTASRMAIEALSCSEFPNSSDTISRQAAIDAINSIDNLDAKARGGIYFKLMGLPSAQPKPKTGHWITLDSDSERYEDIKCPFCGHTFTVDAERWCDIGFIKEDFKFCPNCGTKME